MTDQPRIYLSRGSEGCTLAVRHAGIAIVVDALRASVTIATLFAQGVARVLVVADVDDARALAAGVPDALTIGERGGERLPGFDLGNSPLEVMASPRMDDRTAIFTSSNGAQRLTACGGAAQTLIGGVANATAVAEWARGFAEESHRDIVLIAAGKYPDESYISPEDEATCTYLATRIGLPIAEESHAVFAQWEREMILHGLEDIFRHSRHAQRLMEIGYGDNVLFCTRPDTVGTVPIAVGPVLSGNRQIGVELGVRGEG